MIQGPLIWRTNMQKTSDSTTIRISRKTHETLKDLSRQQTLSMQSVLDAALKKYRQNVTLLQLNDDYAALRKDKQAWKEEQKERSMWENTLSDGLEED